MRSERPLPVAVDDGVKGGFVSETGGKEGDGRMEEAVQ